MDNYADCVECIHFANVEKHIKLIIWLTELRSITLMALHLNLNSLCH